MVTRVKYGDTNTFFVQGKPGGLLIVIDEKDVIVISCEEIICNTLVKRVIF